MKLTIQIPDLKAQRDIDAFCEAYLYVEGAETKQQFVEKKLKEFLHDTSKSYRLQKAREEVTVEE